MSDSEMTTGEVSRSLEALRKAVNEGFLRLREDMDKYVLSEVHRAENDALRSRIGAVERLVETRAEEAKKTARFATGLAVTSVVSVIVAFITVILPIWLAP